MGEGLQVESGLSKVLSDRNGRAHEGRAEEEAPEALRTIAGHAAAPGSSLWPSQQWTWCRGVGMGATELQSSGSAGRGAGPIARARHPEGTAAGIWKGCRSKRR